MKTNLYPIIKKFTDDSWLILEQEQITPWAFMTAGPLFTIKDYYGEKINYKGIEFEGSPEIIFWSRYIEPFLENITDSLVNQTIQLAENKGQNSKLALMELEELLYELINKTYNRMIEIDRNLRGKGNPRSVESRNATKEIETMKGFIKQRITAEQAMYKQKWKINEFYNEHTFLFWFLALLIGGLFSVLAT